VARQIIINATPQEVRVVIMENARILQVQIERARERGIAGSIYKGRVTRVLPGMQAAFVDIGLPKAAFLAGADFFPVDASEYTDAAPGDDDDTGCAPGAAPPTPAASGPTALPPIEQRLQKGQDIIVQIGKEPIGSKGARVTSNLSLPGRLLVYLPGGRQIGVSRRIDDEQERLRLQHAVESVATLRGGVIVRTACHGVPKKEIQADLRVLRNLWHGISRRAESVDAPALLHQDLDLILRTVRDIWVMDVGKIVVDSRRDFERIGEFVDAVMPRWRPRVDLYELPEPIFDRYGIEAQIAKALERRVWLRSGGYVVIDPTEALTSIDVNTGRFVGKSDQRATALDTNLEAARVIADQLRLRNIGGVIVIDFIDMEDSADRQAVLSMLTESLRGQRTRAEVHGFSELGLVEMTRHRNRESLAQRLCEPCPTCLGVGSVVGTATAAYAALRKIRQTGQTTPHARKLIASVPAAVAAFLDQYEPTAIAELEAEFSIEVILDPSADARPDAVSVTAAPVAKASG
jgi:ribonuclease G